MLTKPPPKEFTEEMQKQNQDAGGQTGKEIEITPAMVVAGVKRMRKSLGEFEQSSADAVVVLEVLESALVARRDGTGSFLTPSSKQRIQPIACNISEADSARVFFACLFGSRSGR